MADMMSQLLSLSSTASTPPVADLDLTGCAFHCSKVLYHGLQTDNGEFGLGFTQERVQELASVCLRAARQSTPGQASASIQADIEQLIAHGLSLPEAPPGSMSRTRSLGPGTGTPYLVPQVPAAAADQTANRMHLMVPTPNLTPGTTQPSVGSMQMPPPSSISPMAALSLPMAAESAAHSGTAGVAPSQASAVTSGSNAFEELPDGLNFGPEFFGMDSWRHSRAGRISGSFRPVRSRDPPRCEFPLAPHPALTIRWDFSCLNSFRPPWHHLRRSCRHAHVRVGCISGACLVAFCGWGPRTGVLERATSTTNAKGK